MTTLILCIYAIIIVGCAAKIGLDWVVIDQLKDDLRRSEIVVESLINQNKLLETSKVGILVDHGDGDFSAEKDFEFADFDTYHPDWRKDP